MTAHGERDRTRQRRQLPTFPGGGLSAIPPLRTTDPEVFVEDASLEEGLVTETVEEMVGGRMETDRRE